MDVALIGYLQTHKGNFVSLLILSNEETTLMCP